MPTFKTRDGVNFSFHDTGGAGQPLVLLHGWMQTQESFRHQATGLPSSCRIITVDFRGHGRSDKPRYGYRIARWAMDVAEPLDHLELRQVDALGWSMGPRSGGASSTTSVPGGYAGWSSWPSPPSWRHCRG
jgi:pimeloyl-ACP methyl ester carboxylesterase